MTEDTRIAVANLSEGEIQAKLAALAMVQDNPDAWVEVAPDYGKTIVFQEVGDKFLGLLVGRKVVPLPSLNDPTVLQDRTVFEFMGTDGERYSIWGSYSIEHKLNDVPDGTPCLIEYRGEDNFKDDNGAPRRVRRYKIQMPLATR